VPHYEFMKGFPAHDRQEYHDSSGEVDPFYPRTA
jgi:hypothetical protein